MAKKKAQKAEREALNLVDIELPLKSNNWVTGGPDLSRKAEIQTLEDLLYGEKKFEERLKNESDPNRRLNMLFGELGSMLSTLSRWLEVRTRQGDDRAETILINSATLFTGAYMRCAWVNLPGIAENAKRSTKIPGMISLIPAVQDDNIELCKLLSQGEKVPVRAIPEGGKKAKLNSKSPVTNLVNELYTSMNSALRSQDVADWVRDIGSDTDKEVLNLKPLSRDTVVDWEDLAWRILLAACGGSLTNHEAFREGGPYQQAVHIDKKRGRDRSRELFKQAWDKLTESIE